MYTHRAMFILASCSTTVNFHEFSKIEFFFFFLSLTTETPNIPFPSRPSFSSCIFFLLFSIYFFSFAQALQFLNTQKLVFQIKKYISSVCFAALNFN